MATLPVEPTVTPLRQRMLNDMAMRAMRSRTQHDYAKPPFAGPQAVLAYLSGYTHRVAISNIRLRPLPFPVSTGS